MPQTESYNSQVEKLQQYTICEQIASMNWFNWLTKAVLINTMLLKYVNLSAKWCNWILVLFILNAIYL